MACSMNNLILTAVKIVRNCEELRMNLLIHSKTPVLRRLDLCPYCRKFDGER